MTSAVYAQSLSWGYVYEDTYTATFQWVGWTGVRLHPSRWLSQMLWSGVGVLTAWDPFWQRAVSLALHLVNGTLLWALAWRLRFGVAGAAIATGLFLLHPMQQEAVASVAYRPDLLITLIVLLAIGSVERGWLMWAWGVAGVALLMKPAGVVALALVPLWAWWRGLPSWTAPARIGWVAACGAVLLVGLRDGMERMGFSLGVRWSTPTEIVATFGAWGWLLASWGLLQSESIDPDWALRLTPIMLTALAGGWLALGWAAWRWRGWWALVAIWALAIVVPRVPWALGEGLHTHHLYTMTIVLSLAVGTLCTARKVSR